jgi:hypothetical protein
MKNVKKTRRKWEYWKTPTYKAGVLVFMYVFYLNKGLNKLGHVSHSHQGSTELLVGGNATSHLLAIILNMALAVLFWESAGADLYCLYFINSAFTQFNVFTHFVVNNLASSVLRCLKYHGDAIFFFTASVQNRISKGFGVVGHHVSNSTGIVGFGVGVVVDDPPPHPPQNPPPITVSVQLNQYPYPYQYP